MTSGDRMARGGVSVSKATGAIQELWRAHVEIVEDIADWCGDTWDEFHKLDLKEVLWIFYITLWWIAGIVVFVWGISR